MIASDAIAPVTVSPLQSLPASQPATVPADPDSGFSFKDLLDIVNPLQHIPVVGTLYRAITGDTIKTFPKIAGDTLYGGIEGFVGSMADTIFEKVTGHNMGDTVLAMVEHLFDSSPSDAPATAVASNTPADPSATPAATDPSALTAPAVVSTASLDTLVIPGQEALLSALRRGGVSPDVAMRASTAYRRTISVTAHAALQAPALRATLQ
jgi:hypothetical protein